MVKREEINLTAKPRMLEELQELIPEATSRQEAIRFCVAVELEKRRARRSDE